MNHCKTYNIHREQHRIYPKDYPPCFASRLEQLLIDNSLSNRAFSKKSFISEHSITYWLHEKRQPYASDIILICKYFNVSADWLLGLNNGEGDNES
mgnify:CR=1 FL=1